MAKKLNQRDVNRIHEMYANGVDGHTIAKSFNVAGNTIHYVLRHRQPDTNTDCDRCGKHTGPNRARIVKKAGKAGSFRFCPPCHQWVFTHVAKATKQFKGIF